MLNLASDPIYLADESSPDQILSGWEVIDSKAPQPVRDKVLVVDDQKLIADTVTDILTDAGFQAIPAYDGWSALEAAARFKPDYLLSDVLMPRMNGVQLAIAIRKAYPAAKILLFSGQARTAEILQEGRDNGFEFELLAKPIHPLKLIERLKSRSRRPLRTVSPYSYLSTRIGSTWAARCAGKKHAAIDTRARSNPTQT